MKLLNIQLLFVLCQIVSLAASYAQNGASKQQEDFATKEVRESLQRYSETLRQADIMSAEEAIPKLGEMLVRTFRWKDERSMAVYGDAQQKLLSIPGHATYYRDRINAAKAAVREGTMNLNRWDRLVNDSCQTLQHMQSEEAVEVLAEFVSDNFACMDSENPEDYEIEGLKGYVREWDMSVRVPATKALANIGIENPPLATDSQIDGRELRKEWQQWWREVKEGKRKYRFKGSSVEHPINAPPGTGREVRRPERRPGEQTVPDTTQKPDSTTTGQIHVTKPKREFPSWPLYFSIAAGLLLAVGFFAKLKSRKP